MAFGFPNPFGGSSSSSDKDKNQTSSSTSSSDSFTSDTPSTASSIFSSTNANGSSATTPHALTSSSASSSQEIKTRLQTAIATQSNVANAKALISKINENCFDHCVPAPGTSLSSKEQSCLSACMEKYIDGWNVVSRTYVARLQKEGAQINAGAGAGTGAAGLL